jgi:hypothetical protein
VSFILSSSLNWFLIPATEDDEGENKHDGVFLSGRMKGFIVLVRWVNSETICSTMCQKLGSDCSFKCFEKVLISAVDRHG